MHIGRQWLGNSLQRKRLGLDIGLKGAAFLALQNSVSRPDLIQKLCAPVMETIAV
jgi:hypothetical protein